MGTHNPRLKQDLCDLLLDFIYGPAQAKMKSQLEVVMNSHAVSDPHRSMAFMYKGVVYSPAGFRPVRGQRVSLLPRRLYEHMDKWVKEAKEMEAEKLTVQGYFACLLVESKCIPDMLTLLPECLLPALHDAGRIPKVTQLTQEQIEQFNQKHQSTVQLIKERLVLNLITQ